MTELNDMTLKELRTLAGRKGIVGRWNFNKGQIIKALNDIALVDSYSDDDITFETDCVIKQGQTIQPEGSGEVKRTTKEYAACIKLGQIVAFKLKTDKKGELALSGKFLKFIEDDWAWEDNLQVVTKNGNVYEVEQKDVLWVKTGTKWPKWVLSLFNKNKQMGGEKECPTQDRK